MPMARRTPVLAACTAFALLLASCARDVVVPTVSTDALRTVPFVEPLQYEREPRRTVVDFEMVPLPKDKHLRPVFIGLRFVTAKSSPDPALFQGDIERSIAYRDALSAMRLDARVRVARVTPQGPENVPLTRVRFDREQRMNVLEPAVDGRVTAMFANTADKHDMLLAGLEPADPKLWSQEYTLARIASLVPGRYRVELTFDAPPDFPPGPRPDLIVSRDHPSH